MVHSLISHFSENIFYTSDIMATYCQRAKQRAMINQFVLVNVWEYNIMEHCNIVNHACLASTKQKQLKLWKQTSFLYFCCKMILKCVRIITRCPFNIIRLNPMRTTCWLVKETVLSFIKPMREGVRKSSLMWKFLVQHVQSFIIIG